MDEEDKQYSWEVDYERTWYDASLLLLVKLELPLCPLYKIEVVNDCM